jgi:predicted ATPase
LDALAGCGEICYPEVSRQLIREQMLHGASMLPWNDLAGFARECVERMRAQIADSATHARAFFDRGLPDVAGYLRHGGAAPLGALRQDSQAYAPMVFFAPPWREIYVNDSERPQSFEEAVALSAHIRSTYAEFGFVVVDLDRASVPERVRQVQRFLDNTFPPVHSWAD